MSTLPALHYRGDRVYRVRLVSERGEILLGCPRGDGSSSPGDTLAGEYTSGLHRDKAGLLSTANTGGKQSDGSQCFIRLQPQPWQDERHTIFGEVVSWLDVAGAIAATGSPFGKPTARTLIQRVEILEVEPE